MHHLFVCEVITENLCDTKLTILYVYINIHLQNRKNMKQQVMCMGCFCSLIDYLFNMISLMLHQNKVYFK